MKKSTVSCLTSVNGSHATLVTSKNRFESDVRLLGTDVVELTRYACKSTTGPVPFMSRKGFTRFAHSDGHPMQHAFQQWYYGFTVFPDKGKTWQKAKWDYDHKKTVRGAPKEFKIVDPNICLVCSWGEDHPLHAM